MFIQYCMSIAEIKRRVRYDRSGTDIEGRISCSILLAMLMRLDEEGEMPSERE